MSTPISKTIDINKLIINPNNYRFDKPTDGEREAMEKLFSVCGKPKMFKLMDDIIENGTNPTRKLPVVKFQKNRYKLLDGNRRVTILKLLNNPDLIDDVSIKNKISEIKQTKNVPKEIECVIFNSEQEANVWIEMEHSSSQDGVSTLRWPIKQRETMKPKYPEARHIKDFFKIGDNMGAMTKKAIEKYPITSIDRIFGNLQIKKDLGLQIKDGQIFNLYKDEVNAKVYKVLMYLIKKIIVLRV